MEEKMVEIIKTTDKVLSGYSQAKEGKVAFKNLIAGRKIDLSKCANSVLVDYCSAGIKISDSSKKIPIAFAVVINNYGPSISTESLDALITYVSVFSAIYKKSINQ